MPDIAAALVGMTALVLVLLMAFALLKWATVPSEITEASRQRLVGIGFLFLATGFLGCVVAFVIMMVRLSKGL